VQLKERTKKEQFRGKREPSTTYDRREKKRSKPTFREKDVSPSRRKKALQGEHLPARHKKNGGP